MMQYRRGTQKRPNRTIRSIQRYGLGLERVRGLFYGGLHGPAVKPYTFATTECEPRGVVVRKRGDDPASLAKNRRNAVRGMSAGEDVQRPRCKRLHGHSAVLPSQ